MTSARIAILAVLILSMCGAAQATSVTFTGSQGALAASAMFNTSGSNLVATLTNTSTADCLAPADLLGAVFFDIMGSPTLTRGSAVLASGSHIYQNGAPVADPADGVVGGNWAYNERISGAPNSAGYGISSTGLDVFGPHDVFPGTNLGGETTPPAGMAYNLLSAGDNPSTGNSPLLTRPFIWDSVVFTLGGLPSTFDLDDISNVYFQYGTSLCPEEPGFEGEPPVPPPGVIPEPITAAGLFAGIGALAAYTRRRRS